MRVQKWKKCSAQCTMPWRPSFGAQTAARLQKVEQESKMDTMEPSVHKGIIKIGLINTRGRKSLLQANVWVLQC